MEMYNCPICHQPLKQLPGTRKWVCISEEHDYVQTAGRLRWYQELAEEEALWNIDVLEHAPSVIAYEYDSLRGMLRRGEVTGLSLKLKDVFEACLKFCVLAELSLAFEQKEPDGCYGKLLAELTNRLPSLGTWQMVGQKLTGLYPKRDKGVISILRSLVKLYESEKIVHWRNENVGHGAFTPVEVKAYQEEVTKKIRALAAHFQQEEKEYTALSLELRADEETLVLSGPDLARKLPYTGQSLFLVQSGHEVRLVPLLQNINNGIYFFDSYLERFQVGSYLNYVEGVKLNISNKELEDMCRKIQRIGDLELTGASAEQDIIVRERVEALERLARPDVLVPYEFIENRLEKFIAEHRKGRFLLQMENGMGKTTFVRMMDNLSYNQKRKHKSTLFRAFYINPVYGYLPHSFIQKLTDVLRYTNTGHHLDGKIPFIDPMSPNAASQVADMINVLFETQQQEGEAQRLLIFLDGLDELPNKGQRSLMDFMPLTENLYDGIYIIFTCRTETESSVYTQKLLNELCPDERVCYRVESTEYREVMLETIKKQTKAEKEDAEKLLALAGGRMVHLATAISAYNQYGKEHLDELPELVGQGLFAMLKKLYGTRYYTEIRRIAVCLALLPLPVNTSVLAGLLGEQFVSFNLLAYLGELKPLLNICRQASGTEVSLTRVEVREELLDDLTMTGRLQQSWLSYLLMSAEKYESESKNNIDDAHVDSNDMHIVLTMLLAMLWRKSSIRKQLNPKLPVLLVKAASFYLTHRNMGMMQDEERLFCHLFQCLCSNAEDYIQYQKSADEFVLFLAETLDTLRSNNQGREACESLEQVRLILKNRKIKVNSLVLKQLYSSMGTTYEELDQIDEAKRMYNFANHVIENDKLNIDEIIPIESFSEKAILLIREAVFDKNQLDYAKALNKLSQVDKGIMAFSKQEQQDNIILLELQILRDKTYGNIYKRPEPKKARSYFDQAFYNYDRLATKEVSIGQLQDIKVDLLLNSGQNWRALGDYDKAIESYNEALAIYDEKRSRGESFDEQYYIIIQQSYGNVYRDLGEWSCALEWYDKSLACFEKLSADGKKINDTLYAQILFSRADALEKLNRINEAKEVRDSAKSIDINMARAGHSLRHNITNRELTLIQWKTADVTKRKKMSHKRNNQNDSRQIFWLPDEIMPHVKILNSNEIWLPGSEGKYIIVAPLGEISVTALKKEEFLQRLDRILCLDPAQKNVRSYFEHEQRKIAYLPATEKMLSLWECDSFGKIPRESTAEFIINDMEENE